MSSFCSDSRRKGGLHTMTRPSRLHARGSMTCCIHGRFAPCVENTYTFCLHHLQIIGLTSKRFNISTYNKKDHQSRTSSFAVSSIDARLAQDITRARCVEFTTSSLWSRHSAIRLTGHGERNRIMIKHKLLCLHENAQKSKVLNT